MKVSTHPHLQPAQKLPRPQQPQVPSQPTDKVDLNSQQDPTPPRGSTILAGVGGALLGVLAGQAGPAALASLTGLGAGAAGAAYFGPILKEGMDASLNGDPLNDITTVCGTVAAGGFLLASVAGAAGGLAYPIAAVLPAAAPIVGGLVGASVAAFLASRA